jgi:hypothetical protein
MTHAFQQSGPYWPRRCAAVKLTGSEQAIRTCSFCLAVDEPGRDGYVSSTYV